MLKRPCPHCKRNLSLKQRKDLLFSQAINCIYCAKPIRLSERDGSLNSYLVGGVGGFALAKYTNLSLFEIVLIVSLIMLFVHRFMGIFFSLEEADEHDQF